MNMRLEYDLPPELSVETRSSVADALRAPIREVLEVLLEEASQVRGRLLEVLPNSRQLEIPKNVCPIQKAKTAGAKYKTPPSNPTKTNGTTLK